MSNKWSSQATNPRPHGCGLIVNLMPPWPDYEMDCNPIIESSNKQGSRVKMHVNQVLSIGNYAVLLNDKAEAIL